jgi:hypothetical protein
MYNKALSAADIEVASGYLVDKYNAGTEPQIMDVVTKGECEYYLAFGQNQVEDLNEDCEVDFLDLIVIAQEWLGSY